MTCSPVFCILSLNYEYSIEQKKCPCKCLLCTSRSSCAGDIIIYSSNGTKKCYCMALLLSLCSKSSLCHLTDKWMKNSIVNLNLTPFFHTHLTFFFSISKPFFSLSLYLSMMRTKRTTSMVIFKSKTLFGILWGRKRIPRK